MKFNFEGESHALRKGKRNFICRKRDEFIPRLLPRMHLLWCQKQMLSHRAYVWGHWSEGKRLGSAGTGIEAKTKKVYDQHWRHDRPLYSAGNAALQALRDAGIPTVVWLTPILPFINDTKENISGILDLCIKAKTYGVLCFSMGLTLREGNREYFYRQLDQLFPGLKEKYIRTYGNQYILDSPHNTELMKMFHETCERTGIVHNNDRIFAYLSEFPETEGSQLTLWDM